MIWKQMENPLMCASWPFNNFNNHHFREAVMDHKLTHLALQPLVYIPLVPRLILPNNVVSAELSILYKDDGMSSLDSQKVSNPPVTTSKR
jgi:hypothetical protein